MPGLIGLAALSADVTATMPLNTPAVSTATTGTLPVGATHRLDATSGALARTLPSAATAGPGGIVVVKKTDATSNAVTVTASGSDTINVSGSTRTLTLPREAAHFRSDGVSDWTVVASDTPVTQLDARFLKQTDATASYALVGERRAMLSPLVAAGDSISTTAYAGVAFAAALGGWPLGLNTDGTTQTWNAGVAGNTSTQLLARFGTDVIAKSPKVVHILIGTNDAGTSIPVATSAANIRSMVTQCRAIGARVIIGTPPPTASTSPTDRKARVIALRQWIVRYAIQQRLEVADYYRALVDPATGAYLSGYDSGDGVHPTPAGIAVMAAELAASLNRVPSAAMLLTQDANDPWNFCQNALWLSSWATGWSASGSPTGVTVSTTTSDTNIQGNWGKIAAVSSSGTATYFQNRSTTQGGTAFTVGNWHMLGSRVQSTALSTGEYWNASDKFINLQTFYLGSSQNKFCATPPGGIVLVHEQPATAASTGNQIQVQLSAGTGDVSYAQHTSYDLTAMGVTDAAGNLV